MQGRFFHEDVVNAGIDSSYGEHYHPHIPYDQSYYSSGRYQPNQYTYLADPNDASRQPILVAGPVPGVRPAECCEPVCQKPPLCIFGFNLRSNIFWAYTVILVLVLLLLVYIHFGFDSTNSNVPDAAPSETVYWVGWVITFFIFWYVAYQGYMKAAPDSRRQNLLNVALFLNLALAVFWAVVFFRLQDYFQAFWIIILIVFVVAWWIYLLWDIDQMGAFFLFIHLVFVIYAAYINYQFYLQNTK